MTKKNTKTFLKSKTILGATLVFFATIAPEIVTVEEADTIFQLIVQLAGLGMVVYGRINATHKLTVK